MVDSPLETGVASKSCTIYCGESSLEDRLKDDEYFNNMAWSGGIFLYRPQKHFFKGGTRDNHPCYLGFLASLPVLVAFIVAFYIVWRSPPSGITCRHFVILATFLSWCISPLLTHLISQPQSLSHKTKWHATIFKDAFFALPILALIIGSSCGMFNSCYCFSGVFMFGKKGARVPLDTQPLYESNYRTIYPGMASTCLALQIFIIPAWVWWIGRPGLGVMRWSEKEKKAALLGVTQHPRG
jgi:hypothetical protein